MALYWQYCLCLILNTVFFPLFFLLRWGVAALCIIFDNLRAQHCLLDSTLLFEKSASSLCICNTELLHQISPPKKHLNTARKCNFPPITLIKYEIETHPTDHHITTQAVPFFSWNSVIMQRRPSRSLCDFFYNTHPIPHLLFYHPLYLRRLYTGC